VPSEHNQHNDYLWQEEEEWRQINNCVGLAVPFDEEVIKDSDNSSRAELVIVVLRSITASLDESHK
jgi:hypothetical protein